MTIIYNYINFLLNKWFFKTGSKEELHITFDWHVSFACLINSSPFFFHVIYLVKKFISLSLASPLYWNSLVISSGISFPYISYGLILNLGEESGSPLQCSCRESPRDGGAWWAAIYGVAQSWTRLKRLSSSSSSNIKPRDLFWFKSIFFLIGKNI